MNWTLENALQPCQRQTKAHDTILPQAEFAYINMVNKNTGLNPFSIVYTKALNHTLDLLSIKSNNSPTLDDFAA